MSIQGFLRKCLMQFFIITTCITLAMGILGLWLDPERTFGYDAYFSPIIFGLLSMLPSIITYSAKELTLRQAIRRKVLHWAALETLLITFCNMAGLLRDAGEMFSFGVTVFFVYLAVNLLSWRLALNEAVRINAALEALQRE